MAKPPIRGIQPSYGRRVRGRVASLFQGFGEEVHEPPDPFRDFSKKVHALRGTKHDLIREQDFLELEELARQALDKLEQRLASANTGQKYEIQRAQESLKEQLKRLVDGLPAVLSESEAFQRLLDLLRPRLDLDRSTFGKEPILHGKKREELQKGTVKRWVETADQRGAARRLAAARAAGATDDELAEAGTTLHHAVADLRRMARRGETIELEDADEVAELGLDTMRQLREELSPSWKPEERPRWLNAGDRYVFELALAVVPKGLFEQTAAYDGMQKLRDGQGVFSGRAADMIALGAKRQH